MIFKIDIFQAVMEIVYNDIQQRMGDFLNVDFKTRMFLW
jgi:hypothetical protein